MNSMFSQRFGPWFGHQSIHLAKKKYWHPLIAESLGGIRNQTAIFDALNSQKLLIRAFYVIALVIRTGGHILFVNTNPEYFQLTTNLRNLTQQSLSLSCLSFCTLKWVGGTLTNWKQISKSVLTFAKFSQKCEGFLKKNALEFPRYRKVKNCFQGFLRKDHGKSLIAFTEKPDLVVVFNPNENSHLLREAQKFHIPVIAFVESNTWSPAISYPIPLNLSHLEGVYYCFKKLLSVASLASRES